LRPWTKIVLVIALVGLAIFGISKFTGSNTIENKNDNKGFFSNLFSGDSDKDVITIGTNTYAGFMPFMYLNGGLDPNENSVIYKDYGLKLKIVVQDDFQAGRAAFRNDDIDIIYCTADALPVEMSEGSEMSDARLFNISNWSRGADAIVVNKNINNVGDLIGKVVACSEGTASHTLLLNTLETNGIGYDKVNMGEGVDKNKVNVKVVGSGLDAAAIFKAGQCDAAVVFSPDDQDIVNSINGSKVLVSTKQATNIICDCLIAKQSYLESNKENVQKLISALLYANTLMNTDENAVNEAARAFAKSYGTDEQFAIDGSKNIHYATLGDEVNFFGLNSSYTGIKGDELYSKMARTYEGLNLCKRPLAWRKVSNSDIIEGIMNSDDVKGNQEAESSKTFTAPTKDIENKVAISDKKLTIEYPTNSDILDNDAKTLIDREFVSIAKQFAGARVKIVGNTDNTGNAVYNIDLSKRRAQSVANYLIKEYGFDTNRFIIIGNGSKKAIEDGVNGANQQYRTTDFLLVSE
ncbi:MAG: OmpA family protein, partial [Bacilli bacterium]|nr:OmpA family protein [Bacilli bacterium]